MTDERHSRDERIFWADAFCAMMYGDPELRPVNAAAYADEALDAYRERFGLRPDECAGNTPANSDSSPPKPAFAGEPEPITDDVLRSLGMVQAGGSWWRDDAVISPHQQRLCAHIADARKLRAIMEIIRA